ncbi:MAG: GNAT family N-acetyltransferase [Salinarimonas sp.]|nr:GNAT family N-acetyltransferase [Salinarimonas sp.]
MSELVTAIRIAGPADFRGISQTFDQAWREAYRGVIPGIQLERLVQRRGPTWWRLTLQRPRPVAVLEIRKKIAGYACYGRCRDASIPASGEIDELYLRPEYQGLGFGRRLFGSVRADLRARHAGPILVWSLAENERACGFYEAMGGKRVATRDEQVAGTRLTKVAYRFD